MAFVAAPNCVQLAIIYSLDNQPVENTYHYRLPAPATRAQLELLIGATFTWFAAFVSEFNNNCELIKGYARALDSESAPTAELNPTSTLVGAAAGTSLPNNATFALTRYSGLAGRKNRGRIYWPGINESWINTTNTIKASSANAFVIAATGLKTAAAALTPSFTEIILHRADGTHVDVAAYRYSDLFCDSQRRRLPAHNIHH